MATTDHIARPASEGPPEPFPHAIRRPDAPQHFMVLEPVAGTATARLGGRVIASSERALRAREHGSRELPPVIYFPPGDVHGDWLSPIEKSTRCPLKGRASYFDIAAHGVEAGAAAAAWSYQEVLDFDPRLTCLEGSVAFDVRLVTVETMEMRAGTTKTKERRAE